MKIKGGFWETTASILVYALRLIFEKKNIK